MKYTRFSLMYLASYLTVGGLGFLFVPTMFSKVMFANVFYEEVPLRLAGMFCLLLAIVIIQIIRLRVEVLYTTSVFARIVGLTALLYLYFSTSNSMFLTLSIIVGVGLCITTLSILKDKRD
jgi:uncharacterized protein YjeT (DUF2065 family)